MDPRLEHSGVTFHDKLLIAIGTHWDGIREAVHDLGALGVFGKKLFDG
jgi:hypothetical protein